MEDRERMTQSTEAVSERELQLELTRTGEARKGETAGEAETWPRWAPWAIGIGLLLLGFATGWCAIYLALEPYLGTPALVEPGQPVRVLHDGALVVAVPPTRRVAPGEQVTLVWEVSNIGDTTWVVDRYRFVPAATELAVLSLPQSIGPGETALVFARLTPVPRGETLRPAWTLTGPVGAVPGGRLVATVLIGQSGP